MSGRASDRADVPVGRCSSVAAAAAGVETASVPMNSLRFIAATPVVWPQDTRLKCFATRWPDSFL
jgi:hypothetical protein